MQSENTYFTPKFTEFFKELEKNNNKSWFNSNKAIYKAYVETPFYEFIDQLLHSIKAQDKTIQIDAKDAVFRINRDLRFTKDKSPYKTYKSALISPKGRKFKDEPGFYIEIGADHIKLAGGCFKLTTAEKRLLEHQIFNVVSHDNLPVFLDYFGNILRGKDSLTFETLLPNHLLYNKDLDQIFLNYWNLLKPVIHEFKIILKRAN